VRAKGSLWAGRPTKPVRAALLVIAGLWLSAPVLQISTKRTGPPRPAPIEINLVGYENPGEHPHYSMPSEPTMRYFASKGIAVMRLTAYWNRLQPDVAGPLSEHKVRELEAFLASTDRSGMRVILDLHAFGRRDGHVLGSPQLPTSALAAFWGPVAKRFAGRFAGYDLMNEPHDMPGKATWPDAAQQAVDAIRRHDRVTDIYIEGDDWANAERWPSSNGDLDIQDPANRIIYSAHQYFDADTSGQYRKTYDADGADAMIGVRRLAPFVRWLRDHKFKGHIGEYGVPYADPRWIAVLENFTQSVADNRDVLTGAAYFGAGDSFDWYDLTLQPKMDGRWQDRPQLSVLLKPR
jgi:endoglucanase